MTSKKKSGNDDDQADPDRMATKKTGFYRVTCRDNGCGIKPEVIPEALGRVLAGSKYGVRQTRGKFGLGAKMALIWAKKSTGAPIQVQSATVDAKQITNMTIDIDVYRNEPKILEQTQISNKEKWRGTQVTVVVGGAWSAYKARIITYLQQLAIITPYAQINFQFIPKQDKAKKQLILCFEPRSDKVPLPPKKSGYHPWALNELLLHQLLQRTSTKNLKTFFTESEISGIDTNLAHRLVTELDDDIAKKSPSQIANDPKKVARLSRFLRAIKAFSPPDGSSLSPVGEYNLRLGVNKELDPLYVATRALPKAQSYEGHPFMVEAAVSIGGKGINTGLAAEPGLYIHRFANRIPLLFEAGADVVTRVAKTKIKWSSYKIDPKKDNVQVFVSIVSTKIPFKGTSKEYIGEDATEIHDAVRSCLQHCCSQLRAHLARRDMDRKHKDRRSILLKYAPDVARSLCQVFTDLMDPQGNNGGYGPTPADRNPNRTRPTLTGLAAVAQREPLSTARIAQRREALRARIRALPGNINSQLIIQKLTQAVDRQMQIEDQLLQDNNDDSNDDQPNRRSSKQQKQRIAVARPSTTSFTVRTPLFVFRALGPTLKVVAHNNGNTLPAITPRPEPENCSIFDEDPIFGMGAPSSMDIDDEPLPLLDDDDDDDDANYQQKADVADLLGLSSAPTNGKADKKRAASEQDDDDDQPPPPRKRLRRANNTSTTSSKKQSSIIIIEDDDDDAEEQVSDSPSENDDDDDDDESWH
uniref:DNA topoisomerase VI subunit B transducer domain-containing protein n=1 Tax=Aureoumbra lagunensis TaxID=44058 RepID=A0A7S3JTY5_9STRA